MEERRRWLNRLKEDRVSLGTIDTLDCSSSGSFFDESGDVQTVRKKVKKSVVMWIDLSSDSGQSDVTADEAGLATDTFLFLSLRKSICRMLFSFDLTSNSHVSVSDP